MVAKNPESILLAFCPERTIEGNAINELSELPQIIGGLIKTHLIPLKNFLEK